MLQGYIIGTVSCNFVLASNFYWNWHIYCIKKHFRICFNVQGRKMWLTASNSKFFMNKKMSQCLPQKRTLNCLKFCTFNIFFFFNICNNYIHTKCINLWLTFLTNIWPSLTFLTSIISIFSKTKTKNFHLPRL